MILEIRQSKDDHLKAEIWASGELVKNAKIVKSFNDHGRRSAVVEIIDVKKVDKKKKNSIMDGSKKEEK